MAQKAGAANRVVVQVGTEYMTMLATVIAGVQLKNALYLAWFKICVCRGQQDEGEEEWGSWRGPCWRLLEIAQHAISYRISFKPCKKIVGDLLLLIAPPPKILEKRTSRGLL